MDPLLVLTNSAAGPDAQEALDAALGVLRQRCSVEVQSPTNPGELDSALHRAASRRIVVAGGDGSLHDVVSALYRRNDLKGSVLALLPMGTGNDFARANGIPLDVEEAARVVVDGAARSVDLIVDEVGEVVVNAVHTGAGAMASRLGERWKHLLHRVGVGPVNLGRLGYPIGAVQAAIKPPFVRLRVEVDGEVAVDVDEPVLQLAVGNGSQVGGGTELVPLADPTDGRVDVMISRAIGPIARVAYGAALLAGRQVERPDVLYLRGATVTVTGEQFWCSADGELYGPERHRSWHVEPAAYSLVVPA